MAFETLLGQPTARATLERALSSGRVHHAYRFEGPPGVGKATAALLLARALVCPNDPLGCGSCSSCKRATTLSPEAPHVPGHPDVLFVGRGIYPESVIGKSELTGISVEQVRRIVLARMGYAPHEGKALVVIVHDADELTVAAANGLLKTLEEPPESTHFILLTSRPGQLLDTIRSRTLSVRFGPLPESAVATLLAQRGLPTELAAHARGSMEQARVLTEDGAHTALEAFVAAAEQAIVSRELDAAISFAAERPEHRDELLAFLHHLASSWALRGRAAPSEDGELFATRYAEVERAITEIERNGSPALVLETLITRLRRLPKSHAPALAQQ
ncbi:MAG TPA: DNA polymerase III subunit delta' [Polyangiaceae bacterium]|nr:DNA polymerase III subunit delta' [Polyangiaceae bacterium]